MSLTRILPVTIFGLIATGFLWGLWYGKAQEIPSPLVNKPAPEFDMAPLVEGQPRFATADLKQGKVVIVNVWASWCVPCRAEHPVLMDLNARGIAPIHGLNYKDQPANALTFLNDLGDPFTLSGTDPRGRVGIDWGVYGVPETFVVDGKGFIRYKHIGPLVTRDHVEDLIAAVLAAGEN